LSQSPPRRISEPNGQAAFLLGLLSWLLGCGCGWAFVPFSCIAVCTAGLSIVLGAFCVWRNMSDSTRFTGSTLGVLGALGGASYLAVLAFVYFFVGSLVMLDALSTDQPFSQPTRQYDGP